MNARLRLHSQAVVSEFQDGAVLLDLRTKRYLVLNTTAGAVCRRLVDGAGIEELVDALCAGYEVSRGDAERDVAALLSELREENLVSTE